MAGFVRRVRCATGATVTAAQRGVPCSEHSNRCSSMLIWPGGDDAVHTQRIHPQKRRSVLAAANLSVPASNVVDKQDEIR